MFNILTLNKISPVINDYLPADTFAISAESENPDAVIVRSFNMHETPLGDNLKAIARAGAGVNNIPVDECTKNGVVVFNSPGANSNAVAEMTICSMLMASRNVKDAVNWAATLVDGDLPVTKQVEKGKGQFAGNELMGKTLLIIGLGAIGAKVANKAVGLGMNVIGTDPFLSVAGALSLSPMVKVVNSASDALAQADFVTIHVPLNPATKGTYNAEFIEKCKDGVILVNMSRAEIADSDAMKSALDSGKVRAYACDFPTSDMIGQKNTLLTPHLASGTEEAEDNCAVMASQELYDYLINGNISNSVNYPACSLGAKGANNRVTVLFEEKENVLSAITSAISGITASASATRKDSGVAIFDVSGDVDIDAIMAVDGVVKAIAL